MVAKLADDLYCGGDTPDELQNWSAVLRALHHSGLSLSAAKTIVCPKTTTILGWIWSQGRLTASLHHISTLSTCSPPSTVCGLRSFIGAYKVLAWVIPGCASFLGDLEDAIAGRQSVESISWTDALKDSFSAAQKQLRSARTVTLPKPSDHLWIVTDAAAKPHSLGATLYINHSGKVLLAGFFSPVHSIRDIAFQPIHHPVSAQNRHPH